MDKKKLFKRLASLVLFIFLVNLLAMKFYWYSAIWYFDMPMHFLGGFWLGLAFIWLFSVQSVSIRSILRIILCVLLIGVLWEIFELYFYNHIAQNSFNLLDTLSDISFDVAGGFLAIIYSLKRIMPAAENAV